MREREPDLPNPNNQEGAGGNSSKKSKIVEILHTRSRVRGGLLFVGGTGLVVAGRILGDESLTTAGATAGLFGAAELVTGEVTYSSER
jgi:hypothetical protein